MEQEKKKRGRPPKIRENVVKPPVMPVEPPTVVQNEESDLYKEVLFKTLTEDVGMPVEAAAEMSDKYGRLSVLARAIRSEVELPISDEIYERLRILARLH